MRRYVGNKFGQKYIFSQMMCCLVCWYFVLLKIVFDGLSDRTGYHWPFQAVGRGVYHSLFTCRRGRFIPSCRHKFKMQLFESHSCWDIDDSIILFQDRAYSPLRFSAIEKIAWLFYPLGSCMLSSSNESRFLLAPASMGGENFRWYSGGCCGWKCTPCLECTKGRYG